MATKLSKTIDRLLREGKGKEQIWRSLKNSENPEELTFLLNNQPTLKNRRTFLLLNLPLAAILLIMTGLKFFASVAIGQPNIPFFLSLVVPIINIFVLKKIMRFERTGYQYLFVLSFLSLFQPENHRFLEITLLGVMLFLAGFLYLRMFPRKELIASPGKDKNDQR